MAAIREQSAIDARLAQHMDWVAPGEWRSNPKLDAHVRHEMTDLLERRSDLAATVAAVERAQRTRPLLHPGMGKLYREWVIDARDGLRDPDRRTDAITALRAMVEEIVLTPEQENLELC